MSEDVLVNKSDVIVFQEMEAKRVGDGIRELRERRGLSLMQFARIADIPDDYLGRLEEGNELKVERAVLESIKKASRVFEPERNLPY